MEALSQAKMFTLDKTGTLTNGRFQVNQAANPVSVFLFLLSPAATIAALAKH